MYSWLCFAFGSLSVYSFFGVCFTEVSAVAKMSPRRYGHGGAVLWLYIVLVDLAEGDDGFVF